MPNWVKNIIHIEGPAEDAAKVIDLIRDKKVEGDIDFNNIIPMPERLNIVAGGYDKYYVALYLKTLSESKINELQDKLHNSPLSFYGTYAKKYADSFTIAKGFMCIDDEKLKWMKDKFKERYSTIAPEAMEDIGKAYIDNILEYGHDTWYEWCINNWDTKWNACECKIDDEYLEFQTAWSAPMSIIKELSRKFPELIFHHEWADEDLGSNCGEHEFRNGVVIAEREFESDEEAYEFACMMWGYGPDDLEEE